MFIFLPYNLICYKNIRQIIAMYSVNNFNVIHQALFIQPVYITHKTTQIYRSAIFGQDLNYRFQKTNKGHGCPCLVFVVEEDYSSERFENLNINSGSFIPPF